MKNQLFKDQLVLVTGGSTGIGLSLGKKLSGLGANIWILARRQNALDEALRQIQDARLNSSQRFGTISCDIGNREQLESALHHFQMDVGIPDLLINAAGFAHPDVFLNIEPEIFYRQMDVNYFGTVNTIRSLLPAMMKRNSGYIVNICSVAGFLTFYGYTAYSPTKFAVRGFSDALRSELKFTDVNISICFPPDTDTPGFEMENKTKPEITKEVSNVGKLVHPDVVADSIVRGIQKKRYLIITGLSNNLFFRINNLLGGLMNPVLDMLVSSASKNEAKEKGNIT